MHYLFCQWGSGRYLPPGHQTLHNVQEPSWGQTALRPPHGDASLAHHGCDYLCKVQPDFTYICLHVLWNLEDFLQTLQVVQGGAACRLWSNRLVHSWEMLLPSSVASTAFLTKRECFSAPVTSSLLRKLKIISSEAVSIFSSVSRSTGDSGDTVVHGRHAVVIMHLFIFTAEAFLQCPEFHCWLQLWSAAGVFSLQEQVPTRLRLRLYPTAPSLPGTHSWLPAGPAASDWFVLFFLFSAPGNIHQCNVCQQLQL